MPTAADLMAWATFYGLSFPVLSDPGGTEDKRYDPGDRSRPSYVLLGPGAEILVVGTSVTDAQIEAALPTPYP
ncbi:peroxiredoxin family protein [Myxococcota bacterium]|nr:peroxiredoxin family protein [Myxococcota bacterium]